MSDKKQEETAEEIEKNLPISEKSKNTFKDFYKICRAYYNELLHISKTDNPSLSRNDILILADLIDEIITYSTELLNLNFISSPKKLLETGLVISDFLLTIFQKMADEYNNTMKNNSKDKDKENTNSKKTLNEKMKYPFSLKLKLLKLHFKILLEKDKDYISAEKNLKEIIEIQTMIKASNYNLASSKFWLAKIEYFLEHFDEAEKLALEAKNLYENSTNKKKEEINNTNTEEKTKEINSINNDIEMEKNITQNISNIFRFLAQIYLLKDDYKNAATFYEHGYYLNLGRFGADNNDTIYFKKKLDLINEELSMYPSFQPIKIKNNNNINKNNNESRSPINNQRNNQPNNINSNIKNKQGNILHKGQADTFSFEIPTTLFLEPFSISLFRISKEGIYDRFSEALLFGKVSLNKQKLMKFLNIRENNSNNINTNMLFYTDENLNLILKNMMISNGSLVFLDKELKSCLINASCLVR